MATFTVTNTDDSGAGSLRQALADAEANGTGADTVVFDASLAGSTINLTSGALTITSGTVAINGDTDGDGDADITIQRSSTASMNFVVDAQGYATTVSLNSLVLKNAGTSSLYSGLKNEGTMTISDSVITGQSVVSPDASYNFNIGLSPRLAVAGILNIGTLTVRETVFESLSARGGSGGSSYYDGGKGGSVAIGVINKFAGISTSTFDNTLLVNSTSMAGFAGSSYGFSNGGNGGNAYVLTNPTSVGDAGFKNVTALGGVGGAGVIAGGDGSVVSPTSNANFTLLSAASMAQTTSGADNIVGTSGADTFFGVTGDDTISGDAGSDKLYGGSGTDTLNGGDDGDTLWGWTGGDTLNGDAGDDTLNGQLGIDTLNGGTGLDVLNGQGGDDVLNGGDDADKVYGGSGNDTMYGDGGNDDMVGHQGNDMMYGDAGDDRMFGVDGNDAMQGGDGKDNMFGGAGTDTLNGGAGNDRLTGGADADQFRFTANGFGRDYIVDFTNDEDTLVLDASVFRDTHPTITTVQQVLDTFGTMNAAGTLYTLNFGNGDIIDFKVTAGLTAAALLDDIVLWF